MSKIMKNKLIISALAALTLTSCVVSKEYAPDRKARAEGYAGTLFNKYVSLPTLVTDALYDLNAFIRADEETRKICRLANRVRILDRNKYAISFGTEQSAVIVDTKGNDDFTVPGAVWNATVISSALHSSYYVPSFVSKTFSVSVKCTESNKWTVTDSDTSVKLAEITCFDDSTLLQRRWYTVSKGTDSDKSASGIVTSFKTVNSDSTGDEFFTTVDYGESRLTIKGCSFDGMFDIIVNSNGIVKDKMAVIGKPGFALSIISEWAN